MQHANDDMPSNIFLYSKSCPPQKTIVSCYLHLVWLIITTITFVQQGLDYTCSYLIRQILGQIDSQYIYYFEYFRIHFGIAPQCLFEAHHHLVRAWMKLLNSIFSLLLLANHIHCMSSQTTNSSIPAKRCACIDQVRHGGAVLISTRLFLRVRSSFPNVSISQTLWQRILANRISYIADLYFIKQNGQALSH